MHDPASGSTVDHKPSDKSAAALVGQHGAVSILLLEHVLEGTQPCGEADQRLLSFWCKPMQVMPLCLKLIKATHAHVCQALITAGVKWS